ncbi:hypothetical protein GCM10017567_87170 [Amycolatopsis bullii]|uniref:Uncharacterized protein n=1 Tax=Amycolatopsis bullii TaxID=941987 RepID=A0ABQ3KTZ8_9PSEU|nr:hypothetical protein GCM10017567_87170 [Amycolatopsis bullii]
MDFFVGVHAQFETGAAVGAGGAGGLADGDAGHAQRAHRKPPPHDALPRSVAAIVSAFSRVSSLPDIVSPRQSREMPLQSRKMPLQSREMPLQSREIRLPSREIRPQPHDQPPITGDGGTNGPQARREDRIGPAGCGMRCSGPGRRSPLCRSDLCPLAAAGMTVPAPVITSGAGTVSPA